MSTGYRLSNTAICSVTALEAPERVPSTWIDEQLAGTYQRVGMTPGKFDDLAGIDARHWWPTGTAIADVAAEAGAKALAEAGVEPSQVGVVINSSVTREHLEPSLAVAVHERIGLAPTCLNFDVANACLAFVNAMQIAGTMIDAGQVRYALIVNGENVRPLQERTLERLQRPDATKQDVKDQFATLTLGCGATAMVLGRADDNPGAHRVVGGTQRTASQHSDLCVGSMDRMRTDTRGLFDGGLALAAETWQASDAEFGWSGADYVVPHQTSRVHITGLCRLLGLDESRFQITMGEFGNLGPASVPFALAKSMHQFGQGDDVMLLGIGSGLNTAFAKITW